jgi:hypothetical protein
MLRADNTVFMPEALLQPYVYARPWELERGLIVRRTVVCLLNMLVENGGGVTRFIWNWVHPSPEGVWETLMEA